MKLVWDEKIDRERWNRFVADDIHATPFQTPGYFDLVNSVDPLSARAIAVEENGRICALAVVTVQKERGVAGYFSRRGILFGGPLFSPERPDALEFLLNSVGARLRRETIYLETRNASDYESQRSVFSGAGWNYVAYGNFRLRLAGRNPEEILSGMDYNRRREIRMSINEGATYGECSGATEVGEVYSILRELYRERVRLPLPSLSFFEGLHTSGVGKVFVVKHHGQVIGGSFCPVLPDRAIYTLYYCGIRNFHKRVFPTHLAILAAVEYAVHRAIPLLDFMGAGKPGIDYGVRKYKKEFGGEPVEYGRFLKINRPVLYYLGKAGLRFRARLKPRTS